MYVLEIILCESSLKRICYSYRIDPKFSDRYAWFYLRIMRINSQDTKCN